MTSPGLGPPAEARSALERRTAQLGVVLGRMSPLPRALPPEGGAADGEGAATASAAATTMEDATAPEGALSQGMPPAPPAPSSLALPGPEPSDSPIPIIVGPPVPVHELETLRPAHEMETLKDPLAPPPSPENSTRPRRSLRRPLAVLSGFIMALLALAPLLLRRSQSPVAPPQPAPLPAAAAPTPPAAAAAPPRVLPDLGALGVAAAPAPEPVAVPPVPAAQRQPGERYTAAQRALVERLLRGCRTRAPAAKILDVLGDSARVRRALGECALGAKRFAEAQEHLGAALAQDPEERVTLLALARAYHQDGKVEQAVAHYERYASQAPKKAARKVRAIITALRKREAE